VLTTFKLVFLLFVLFLVWCLAWELLVQWVLVFSPCRNKVWRTGGKEEGSGIGYVI
jgi:hypothetical protein